MKVNTIIEQLDELDGNEHRRNTNINHFAPLFESHNEEGTEPGTKPNNTPIIVLIEDEEKDQNKG